MKHLVRIETFALFVVIVALLIPVWWAAATALVLSLSYNIWLGFHGRELYFGEMVSDIAGIGLGSLLAWLTIICNTFI